MGTAKGRLRVRTGRKVSLAVVMKLLGLVILLGGVLLMRKQVMMGLRSTTWPSTAGTVVSVDRVYSGSGDDGEPTYNEKVEYSYAVDGREYLGNLVAALAPVKSSEQVQTVLARYPIGLKVEVYFDPEDPSLSLLVPGLSGFAKAGLVVYVACIILLTASLFITIPYSDGL